MNRDISGVLKVIGWSICVGVFIAGLIIFLLPGFGGQFEKEVRVRSRVGFTSSDYQPSYYQKILVTNSKEIGIGLMSASAAVVYFASGLWRRSYRDRNDGFFS